MLGESKDGIQSQSIAPSAAHERAGMAVGKKCVVRDRRKRRRCGGALRCRLCGRAGAHDEIHGPCQRP